MKEEFKQLKSIQFEEREHRENKKVLKWYQNLNPFKDIFKKLQRERLEIRTESTGQTMLEYGPFVKWSSGDPDAPCSYFISGAPGVGKSIQCAIIVDFLKRQVGVQSVQDGNSEALVVVLFIYCSNDQEMGYIQTAKNFLRSLLHQLIESIPYFPQAAEELYALCTSDMREPSMTEIIDTFCSILERIGRIRIFLVVDGFDAMSLNERRMFLSSIRRLLARFSSVGAGNSSAVQMRFLAFSRNIAGFLNATKTTGDAQDEGRLESRDCSNWTILPGEPWSSYTEVANMTAETSDIKKYLSAAINSNNLLWVRRRKERTISVICDSSRGIFLLAKLYFDSFLDKSKVSEHEALLELGRIEGTKTSTGFDDESCRFLHQMYQDILFKITSEGDRKKREFVQRILGWMLCLQPSYPVSVDALRYGLASPGFLQGKEAQVKPEFLANGIIEAISSSCVGLLNTTWAEGGQIVRFSHETARQYLCYISGGQNFAMESFVWLDLAVSHMDIAESCLRHFNFVVKSSLELLYKLCAEYKITNHAQEGLVQSHAELGTQHEQKFGDPKKRNLDQDGACRAIGDVLENLDRIPRLAEHYNSCQNRSGVVALSKLQQKLHAVLIQNRFLVEYAVDFWVHHLPKVLEKKGDLPQSMKSFLCAVFSDSSDQTLTTNLWSRRTEFLHYSLLNYEEIFPAQNVDLTIHVDSFHHLFACLGLHSVVEFLCHEKQIWPGSKSWSLFNGHLSRREFPSSSVLVDPYQEHQKSKTPEDVEGALAIYHGFETNWTMVEAAAIGGSVETLELVLNECSNGFLTSSQEKEVESLSSNELRIWQMGRAPLLAILFGRYEALSLILKHWSGDAESGLFRRSKSAFPLLGIFKKKSGIELSVEQAIDHCMLLTRIAYVSASMQREWPECLTPGNDSASTSISCNQYRDRCRELGRMVVLLTKQYQTATSVFRNITGSDPHRLLEGVWQPLEVIARRHFWGDSILIHALFDRIELLAAEYIHRKSSIWGSNQDLDIHTYYMINNADKSADEAMKHRNGAFLDVYVERKLRMRDDPTISVRGRESVNEILQKILDFAIKENDEACTGVADRILNSKLVGRLDRFKIIAEVRVRCANPTKKTYLHTIVASGSGWTLRLYMRHGVFVSFKCLTGRLFSVAHFFYTPLHTECSTEMFSLFIQLHLERLEQSFKLTEAERSFEARLLWCTALDAAIRCDSIEKVSLLLNKYATDSGISVEDLRFRDGNPLLLAASMSSENSVEIVCMLLEKGLQQSSPPSVINHRAADNVSSVASVHSVAEGREGLEVTKGNSIWWEAISEDDSEMVISLLSDYGPSGCPILPMLEVTGGEPISPLQLCVRLGKAKACKVLLERVPTSEIQNVDDKGNNLIHQCIQGGGEPEVIRMLALHGVDKDERLPWPRLLFETPLALAIRTRRNMDAVAALLDVGAFLFASPKHWYPCDLLHYATGTCHPDCGIRSPDIELSKLLLERNFDPNVSDRYGRTPLIALADAYEKDEMRPELESMTSRFARGLAPESPLLLELAALLISKGADPKAHCRYEGPRQPFLANAFSNLKVSNADGSWAGGHDVPQFLELPFQKVGGEAVEEDRRWPSGTAMYQDFLPTALFFAVWHGNIGLTELLLRNGASKLIEGYEFSALNLAVRRSHYELARWLIGEGHDPNEIDNQGREIFLYPYRTRDIRMCKILLDGKGRIPKSASNPDNQVCGSNFGSQGFLKYLREYARNIKK
ncbi:hypothetical protein BJ508DRAFT_52477 [Ascobolus immersus RN42]|uniref:Nephrocystin 3-like N-terminal domain-containing protein n=1 Tax=Ascobolus immersus RN42 TaxID=1160509 RepID=A0A3N4IQN1_ASCIM|nr:hypothetical protein BJ508DRAFT_52477 [Ascobolus immersus RN42]